MSITVPRIRVADYQTPTKQIYPPIPCLDRYQHTLSLRVLNSYSQHSCFHIRAMGTATIWLIRGVAIYDELSSIWKILGVTICVVMNPSEHHARHKSTDLRSRPWCIPSGLLSTTFTSIRLNKCLALFCGLSRLRRFSWHPSLIRHIKQSSSCIRSMAGSSAQVQTLCHVSTQQHGKRFTDTVSPASRKTSSTQAS
jgi:hypothetical protein